ncbi:MAG: hypothetical protein E6190_05235 [Finegoldia magna]|uniref:hypothetical protein n=1 Tax=Finegoldia magna TaxID=1260 RepID=UPI00291300F4|nr:hypothetical protein [Finegoldia magna]MDU5215085.1 hypothetical protein [Finegoldia magna]MDU5236314.1 hypothetical protein [Finegoldia magna]
MQKNLKKLQDIKIYPEWNVNVQTKFMMYLYNAIKIYPEWNVNTDDSQGKLLSMKLKSIQSGM